MKVMNEVNRELLFTKTQNTGTRGSPLKLRRQTENKTSVAALFFFFYSAQLNCWVRREEHTNIILCCSCKCFVDALLLIFYLKINRFRQKYVSFCHSSLLLQVVDSGHIYRRCFIAQQTNLLFSKASPSTHVQQLGRSRLIYSATRQSHQMQVVSTSTVNYSA